MCKIDNNTVKGVIAGITNRHWILQSRYNYLRNIRTVERKN
jgi:hypothetical protein